MNDARAAIGALISEPNKLCPIAWAMLRPEDFTDPGHRLIFQGLTEAWELAGGDFHPGPRYHAIIAASLAKEFGHQDKLAWQIVQELMDWGIDSCYPDAFSWRCERILAASALRRVRGTVYRWYAALTPLRLKGYGGPAVYLAFDDDTAGGEALLHACQRVASIYTLEPVPPEEMPDPRSLLAALLKDIRRTLRRTPRKPATMGLPGKKTMVPGQW